MAAITFPLNPANGDTHLENGITFEYDSTSESWKKQISIGTLEASSSTFSVTSAVTEEFNRTLGSGVSTNLTLTNDHNDKALVHAKKFIPGDDVTDINWDFDTTDESQWNFLSDKIEFVDGKVRLKGVLGVAVISSISTTNGHTMVVTAGGDVYGTGNNGYGQLGIGSISSTVHYTWVKSDISGVSSISCGGSGYSVALMNDGSVKGVGRNGEGQLGLGNNTTPQTSWVTLITSGATSVACGDKHTLVRMDDSSVKGTGQSTFGQLGIGTSSYNYFQTIMSSGVYKIYARYSTSGLLMQTETVKLAGYNSFGQLGTGNTTHQSNWYTPSELTNVSDLHLGEYHTFAIRSNNSTVKGAGRNNYGQLGTGSTSGDITTFTNISGLSGAVSIASEGSGGSTMALLSTGVMKSVGYNSRGQLGIGNKINQTSLVTSAITGVVDSVVGGASFYLALMQDGTLQGVGLNSAGTMGYDDNGEYTSWVTSDDIMSDVFNEPNGTVDSVSSISLSNTATINSLAITENKPTGTDIKYAISFDGKTTWRVPSGAITDITTEGVDATTLATYDFTGFTGTTLDIQSYLTTTDTTVSPDIDQITVGLTVNGTYTQVAIDGVTLLADESGTNTVTVTNGDTTEETYNFMVSVDVPETITVDGIVGGVGATGPAGPDGTIPPSHSSTFTVTSAVTEEFNRTLGSGVSTNLTLTNDHNDKALVHAKKFVPGSDVTDINWDFDTTDESQWNFLSDKIEFVDGKVRLKGVTTGAGISDISCGLYHSMALMTDGTVQAVGSNNYGQLGDGTTTDKQTWVTSNISGVSTIVCGHNHTLAIMTDNTLKSVGNNDNGQLGIGNTTNKDSWVDSNAGGLSGVSSVAAGNMHSMAVLSDGTVKAVGYNGQGGLGLSNTTNQTSWVASGSNQHGWLSGVSSVSCGHYHSAVVMSDGTMKSTGKNAEGQLGVSTTNQSTFWLTAVTQYGQTVTGIASVSCGREHTLIVMTDGTVKATGGGGFGKLGNGGTSNSSYWVDSNSGGLTGVVQVATGEHNSWARLSNGTVKAVGRNHRGQLSQGNTTDQSSWVTSNLTGVSTMSGGEAYAMALLSDGTVQGVGANDHGEIGLDNLTHQSNWIESGIQSTIATAFNEPNGTVDSISSISLANTATINSLAITENKPTGTDIKYAISFDGKSTWSVPAGVITDITTEGVDATTLATYDFTGFTGTTLDIQSYLTTTDTTVSPDIDLITVGLSQNGTYTQVAIDGVTLLASESGTNTVTVTNSESTEETYNFMVSVDVPETITVDGIVGATGAAGSDGAAGGITSMGGVMTNHIIPDTNSVYDIGSAEYKVRHLFLSDNSLWIGDDHKVSIEGGKQKQKKRKKGKTPKKIFDALIGAGKLFPTEADLKIKFKTDIHDPAPVPTSDPDHADFQPKVHQWLHFAITNGMAGTVNPENIFDGIDDFEDESPETDSTTATTDPLITSNLSVGHFWINSTSGEAYVCTDATTDDNVWTNIGGGSGDIKSVMVATGGIETTYSADGVNYKSHTFLSSENFTTDGVGLVDILVVAGGGAGGGGNQWSGGGGGAGGMIVSSGVSLTSGTLPVVIGAGGSSAGNGENTTFNDLISIGGGGGGLSTIGDTGGTNPLRHGKDGGSGGGGSEFWPAYPEVETTGGTGVAGQGHAGGGSGSQYASGGGGGAGTSTLTGSAIGIGGGAFSTNDGPGGDGGDGLINIFRDGTEIYYAGGGAGNGYVTGATGGAGGGGTPANNTGNVVGAVNSGGGGSGGQGSGGNGGSGIVIVRYET